VSRFTYEHFLGKPCPLAGGPAITETFTDHARPGVYNACDQCHDDRRTIAARLVDLEEQLAAEAVVRRV
jgi:hypothetical protein